MKGIYSNYYKQNRKINCKENMSYILVLSISFIILTLIFSLLYTLDVMSKKVAFSFLFFLPAFILTFILSLIYYIKKLDKYIYSNITLFIFSCTVMGFGWRIGIIDHEQNATMINILAISIILIFTAPISYKFILVISFYACYLIQSFFVKPIDIFENEVIIAILLLMISFLLNIIIRKHKISAFVASSKLNQLSSLDELTKLPNRRMLNQYFDSQNSNQNNSTLSCLMIDIDDFKNFNDLFGHLTGDEILIKVSQVLNSISNRELLFISRFGGEEFVAISFIKTEREMLQIAYCIQDDISKIISDSGKKITVSIGSYTTSNKNEFILDECISKADKALYDAKKKGKNLIQIYEKETDK